MLAEEAHAKTQRDPLSTGMTCLASPLRHSTERRIPPLSQGRPYLSNKPSSCRKETSSHSLPPLLSPMPRLEAGEVVAEEALGSRETPSQLDPKVSGESSQNLHLVNASPKEVSLEPRSGSQDLHLLKSSIKEVSLNPLSPVANIVTPASNDEHKLPCGRTPSYLKRRIAEMEEVMTSCRDIIWIFEKQLVLPGMSEKFKSERKQLIIKYRKKYEKYDRRRNQYQRQLMEGQNNE